MRRRTAGLLVSALAIAASAATALPAAADPLPPSVLTFRFLAVDGYTPRTLTAGSGTDLRLGAGWSSTIYGAFEPPHAVLQRRLAGGAWSTVADAPYEPDGRFSASTGPVRVDPHRARQRITYRFAVLPTTTAAGSEWQAAVSASITITYENQARYTGTARAAYRAMQHYCPASAVHVRDHIEGDSLAGRYLGGSTTIEIATKVGGYAATDLRSVALHECAHERQFLNWGASPEGDVAMTAAMRKRFVPDVGSPAQRSGTGGDLPFSAVEHAADCAALSIEPKGYLGYGGWCSRKELRAGRALLEGRTAAR